MSIPFWKRAEYIKKLFDYEEENDIPDSERLTYDPYKDEPDIPEASPRKKAYVDIRRIIGIVNDLEYHDDEDDEDD